MEINSNGMLVHGGIVVGKVEATGVVPEDAEGKSSDGDGGALITLNLGWCAAAGVHVKVLGDPEVEKRRVVLDR